MFRFFCCEGKWKDRDGCLINATSVDLWIFEGKISFNFFFSGRFLQSLSRLFVLAYTLTYTSIFYVAQVIWGQIFMWPLFCVESKNRRRNTLLCFLNAYKDILRDDVSASSRTYLYLEVFFIFSRRYII